LFSPLYLANRKICVAPLCVICSFPIDAVVSEIFSFMGGDQWKVITFCICHVSQFLLARVFSVENLIPAPDAAFESIVFMCHSGEACVSLPTFSNVTLKQGYAENMDEDDKDPPYHTYRMMIVVVMIEFRMHQVVSLVFPPKPCCLAAWRVVFCVLMTSESSHVM
jgi:hypothetical protein